MEKLKLTLEALELAIKLGIAAAVFALFQIESDRLDLAEEQLANQGQVLSNPEKQRPDPGTVRPDPG